MRHLLGPRPPSARLLLSGEDLTLGASSWSEPETETEGESAIAELVAPSGDSVWSEYLTLVTVCH